MRNTHRAMLLMASMMLTACGASAEGVVDQKTDDEPSTDRSSTYVSPPDNAPPGLCGWVELPNGGVEYLPCPSLSPRSPISDQPEEEHESQALPRPIERPEPPGDPPPM